MDNETQEAEVKPTEDVEKTSNVASLENLDADAIAGAFASKFSDMGDFGPDSIDDLQRQSAYRISVGGSQEFNSQFNDSDYLCRLDLNDALLTALSYGENTSQSTGRKYNIVQGQMRINADIYAQFGADFVHINHIQFLIFKKFLNADKVGNWDYDSFVQFCKNAGFPIDNNYIFNFELLGAHGPAIEKYMPIFLECGAVSVDRARKPQFIKETFEFPTRNVGLAVTNLEIGGSDPEESRLYGKTFVEDGEEKVYDNPTFIDPFHAQMGNFHRFMSHYKQSVVLKRQAATAGEAADAVMEKSKVQRQMARSFLNNFGGVHRAAQPGQNDTIIVENQYYQNRVRCGRYGVRTTPDQVVEMNFWQPETTSAGVAVTADSSSDENKMVSAITENVKDVEEDF